ncbi:ferrochelatase-like protein [Leptotrombidium deliense]|uniref:Ferrochelatase n=1 Tax=Leptotrombidium deliense TaxID=299467 RepID=A0A443STV9_9ACAR|nr:ferrochelatase-like protein [Leptotrombidium deliense]
MFFLRNTFLTFSANVSCFHSVSKGTFIESRLQWRHYKNTVLLPHRKFSSAPKTAVLMLNMGGPADLGEVEPFLTRLFTDKDIIPLPMQSKLGPLIAKRRTPKVTEKYREIGGGSPIKSWTTKQGDAMVKILDKISPESAPHKFYIGFRYAQPLMEDTIEEMHRDGVERAIAFSQYPQYSCSTSGSSFNALAKYYLKSKDNVKLRWSFIDRWPVDTGLVEAFKDLTLKEAEKFSSDVKDDIVILFSAHSLPMSAVNRGDPYPVEVAATVLKVMQALNWRFPYRLVWQSKVGPVPWLSPQTDDALRGFVNNGHRNFLIVPISFVNEHIETLHELDIEYAAELAQKLKIENIRRVPAPNDHPAFIEGLAKIVKGHIDSGEVCSKQLLLKCPMCTKAVCSQMRQWIGSMKN